MKKTTDASLGQPASELISQRIAELGDWRGKTLARMRQLIQEADPEVIEEWKWRGTPVWSQDGIICTGEAYQGVVKLTFARGASLPDPAGLFNASLEGNMRRAIDIREGEEVDAAAFKTLVCEAVALNRARRPASARSAKPATKPMKPSTKAATRPGAKASTKPRAKASTKPRAKASTKPRAKRAS